MIGMSKQEVIDKIGELNDSVYSAILARGANKFKSLDQFLLFYQDEILIPLTGDLIEANNQKITKDIQALLSK